MTEQLSPPALPTTQQEFGAAFLPIGWDVVEQCERAVKQGQYSGVRARLRLEYEQVKLWLAEGLSLNEVHRLSGWDRRTLARLRENDGSTIAQLKEEVGKRAMSVARQSLETFEHLLHIGAVDAKTAIIGFGIATEKALLAMGEATVITGTKGDVGFDEAAYQRAIEALPSCKAEPERMVESESVGVASLTLAEGGADGGSTPASTGHDGGGGDRGASGLGSQADGS